MIFKRLLRLEDLSRSAFLFGPRMTGKTFLLNNLYADRRFPPEVEDRLKKIPHVAKQLASIKTKALSINLMDPELELKLRQSPRIFWEEISALPAKALVIVDEIQRVPVLLDYVQRGIEEKQLIFVLSGSSARKLKRGGANLLGGRAKDLKLHPLT